MVPGDQAVCAEEASEICKDEGVNRPAAGSSLFDPACVQEHEAMEDTFKTVYLFKVVVSTKLRRWVTRKRFSQFEQLWLQVL